jgi:hypothetical protein
VGKTFAGPIATLVASFAAIWFANAQRKIAASQRDIAASQRDIAHDRLKYDLFQKRYVVYNSAKELLRLIQSDYRSLNPMVIRDHRIALDEARFFFPDDVRHHLKVIEDACETYLVRLSHREASNQEKRSVAGNRRSIRQGFKGPARPICRSSKSFRKRAGVQTTQTLGPPS